MMEKTPFYVSVFYMLFGLLLATYGFSRVAQIIAKSRRDKHIRELAGTLVSRDTCNSCRFFLKHNPHSGICRYSYPDTHLVTQEINGQMQSYHETVWPNVGPDEWCGNHEEAE